MSYRDNIREFNHVVFRFLELTLIAVVITTTVNLFSITTQNGNGIFNTVLISVTSLPGISNFINIACLSPSTVVIPVRITSPEVLFTVIPYPISGSDVP